MLNRILRPAIGSAAFVALVIALVIALAACGNSSDDVTSVAQPTSTAVAAVMPEPTAIPDPQATHTPVPTATSAPVQSPTAIAETPTPSPEVAEVKRLSEKGMALLVEFTEEYSPRRSGSSQEATAARFIGQYMEDLGYRVGVSAGEGRVHPLG